MAAILPAVLPIEEITIKRMEVFFFGFSDFKQEKGRVKSMKLHMPGTPQILHIADILMGTACSQSNTVRHRLTILFSSPFTEKVTV